MTDIVPIPGAGMGGGDPTMRKLMSVADESRGYSASKERELTESQAREETARRQQMAAVAPKQAELGAKLKQGSPTPPPAVPTPAPPAAPQLDPQQMRETLGLITFLASIGGAFTRHPLTSALNSFAAGVDGLHKGQQDVYAQKTKEFEESLKKASAENDQLWKRYEAASKKFGIDTKGLADEIKLIAAQSQSTIDLELAKQGRIVELIKLHENANNSYARVLGEVAKYSEQVRAHSLAHEDRQAALREAGRNHDLLNTDRNERRARTFTAADQKVLKEFEIAARTMHAKMMDKFNKATDEEKARIVEQFKADEDALITNFRARGLKVGIQGHPQAPSPTMGAAPEASPAAGKYKSADEVRADFRAGKIPREAARKILTDQFPDALGG